MHRIPQDRRWKADYSSDLFGSFVASQNLDFDREGYLQLSGKPVNIYNQDDDADFVRPSAMAYLTSPTADDIYVIATRGFAFQMTLSDGVTVSEIPDSPALTGQMPDCIVFNSTALFTRSTTIDAWNGADWSAGVITSLSASAQHPLCVFENRVELAVGDGNLVKTYNTSYVLQQTLTLPANYHVVTIRWEENKLFIGTRNIHGGDALIFTWNGTTTSAQNGYSVRAPRVYSLCNYKGGIIAVVSTGQVLRWNGGGFAPLKDYFGVEANFPVWYESRLWQDEDAGTALIGKVYDRGTVADGDLIYFNVSSPVASNEGNTLIPNFPSGIWVFDPKVGLYHKALPSADKVQTVSVSSVSSSVLTLASATQAQTGEPVLIDDVGSLTGISANLTYYAIIVTTTTIKLALTQADALAGTFITLGGSAGTAAVVLPKNNQIGSVNDSEAGPICLVNPADLTDTFFSSPIVWAGRPFKNNDVSESYDSIMMLSKAFNVGYFITPKLYGKSIKEAWGKLYTKLQGLNLEADKIVIKYRTRERFGLPTPPMAGTYSSSTVIGSDADYFGQVAVGDEVVITKGIGAGRSAHITTVNGNELTLDEAIPNAASTNELEFYVTDFKHLATLTNDDPNSADCYSEHDITDKTSWIQFKVELRGSRPAIEELSLPSTVDKPVA